MMRKQHLLWLLGLSEVGEIAFYVIALCTSNKVFYIILVWLYVTFNCFSLTNLA